MADPAANLAVDVVTPERLVLRTRVSEISAPGKLGEFGILPQHTPFMTVLGIGILSFTEEGKKRHFVVRGGFAEISQDHVIVLTEGCEEAQSIDLDRARSAISQAERELSQSTPETYEKLFGNFQLAQARLEAAEMVQ